MQTIKKYVPENPSAGQEISSRLTYTAEACKISITQKSISFKKKKKRKKEKSSKLWEFCEMGKTGAL